MPVVFEILIKQVYIQQDSCRETYLIYVDLLNPIYHIHKTLLQAISIFFLLYKLLWMTKDFLKMIQ